MWDDATFLRYCLTHSESPRCAFAAEHLARLCHLAGKSSCARMWELCTSRFVEAAPERIRELVRLARAAPL